MGLRYRKLGKVCQIMFGSTRKNTELQKWKFYHKMLENMNCAELTDEYCSTKISCLIWKGLTLVPIFLWLIVLFCLYEFTVAIISINVQSSGLLFQKDKLICKMYGYFGLIFFVFTWITAEIVCSKLAVLQVKLELINDLMVLEKK